MVCVEAGSGGLVWQGQVEGRAEAGLAITSDCKVALRKDQLGKACLLVQKTKLVAFVLLVHQ